MLNSNQKHNHCFGGTKAVIDDFRVFILYLRILLKCYFLLNIRFPFQGMNKSPNIYPVYSNFNYLILYNLILLNRNYNSKNILSVNSVLNTQLIIIWQPNNRKKLKEVYFKDEVEI